MAELKKFLQHPTRYNTTIKAGKLVAYKKKFVVDDDGNTTSINWQKVIEYKKNQIEKIISDMQDTITDLTTIKNMIW